MSETQREMLAILGAYEDKGIIEMLGVKCGDRRSSRRWIVTVHICEPGNSYVGQRLVRYHHKGYSRSRARRLANLGNRYLKAAARLQGTHESHR